MAIKSKCLIAVIIVNWNSGNYLSDCVAGLLKQTLKPDRILIIDNASSDNSLDTVRKLSSNIEIIEREENYGFAASNNFAATRCQECQWLALLNPDTIPEPDWLKNLATAATQNTDYSMFASKQLQMGNPDILDGAGDCYHISGMMWHRGAGKPVATIPDIACEVFSPCGGAAFISREAFVTVGGFDEDFFCYAEDIDLGFRLRLLGHKCLYIPTAVIYHEGCGSSGKKSDFTVYHGQRNLIWVYVKNMPIRLLLTYLPLHILINLAALFKFSLRGQAKVVFKAKLDALKNLKFFLKKRKVTQKMRAIPTYNLTHIINQQPYI